MLFLLLGTSSVPSLARSSDVSRSMSEAASLFPPGALYNRVVGAVVEQNGELVGKEIGGRASEAVRKEINTLRSISCTQVSRFDDVTVSFTRVQVLGSWSG